jgi:hypothetical protein
MRHRERICDIVKQPLHKHVVRDSFGVLSLGFGGVR